MQFGLIVANQNKKTRIRTFSILKTLYAGCLLHERSNITAPFAEHLKFLEKNNVCRNVLGETRQKKWQKKKKNKNTIHFQTARYRVLHKRTNTTAPFT